MLNLMQEMVYASCVTSLRQEMNTVNSRTRFNARLQNLRIRSRQINLRLTNRHQVALIKRHHTNPSLNSEKRNYLNLYFRFRYTILQLRPSNSISHRFRHHREKSVKYRLAHTGTCRRCSRRSRIPGCSKR